MPEIQGPSFDCPDLCVDLPSHLGPSLGLCPLFLREPPVGGVQRREPRSALLCPWAGASTPVEPAAPYWELGWPLAKRASSRSGLAPCAWPVWAEACFLANSVAFGEHLNTPINECYIITNT